MVTEKIPFSFEVVDIDRSSGVMAAGKSKRNGAWNGKNIGRPEEIHNWLVVEPYPSEKYEFVKNPMNTIRSYKL